jgi:hypothetical protein
VFSDSKQPVDLRVYVQRHGGRFPSTEWYAVIFDPPVENAHRPVWNRIRADAGDSTASSQIMADGMVAAIADYVVSIQITRKNVGSSPK